MKAIQFVAVFPLVLAANAHAQTLPDLDETAQGDVAVTIYNNDIALVQDVRQLDIANGRSQIAFPDVSARIRPETLSFAADGAAIVEQNFDFDLLTPSKLMEKAIGQTVTLLRTNPATGVETRERATVLSTAGGVVIRVGDRIEVLRDDGLPVRVVFDRVPPNLRARPTLSVNVESSRSGVRPAAIRYLTSGLGWSSDYVALFDEGRNLLDMQGWITLTNNTGTTFRNADTLLVAGDPSSGDQRRSGYRPPRPSRDDDDFVPGTEAADRERLGDYYLYPLPERTTIANAQTKQVSFLDVQSVPAKRTYSRYISWMANDDQPQNVATSISFTTSRNAGLGDALPAGTVRFYQRDSRGDAQYVGENSIGHTPMGSRIGMRTGDAFDVFVQSELVGREEISSGEYERSARYRVIEDDGSTRTFETEREIKYYRTTIRYTLFNAKPQPVKVEIYQGLPGLARQASDFRIVSEDVPGRQQGVFSRAYEIEVPPNGERKVEVTYETRF